MTITPSGATAAGTPPAGDADGADRPWLEPPATNGADEVSRRRVVGWREEIDRRHQRAGEYVDRALAEAGALTEADGLAEAGAPGLPDGVTAVVLADRGPEELERCLRSLAEQTLGPDLLEVIAVLTGPLDGARAAVARVRAAHPTFTARLVRLPGGGPARAYHAGCAAAGRRYTTFVDGRDTLSPSFAEVLLAHAGPRVVPVAPVAEAGAPVPLDDLGAVASMPGGKLVATRLARDVGYDRGLVDGEDLLFWATVAVQGPVTFRPVAAAGATYHRCRRPPAGEPDMTLERAVRGIDLIAALERVAGGSDPGGRTVLRQRIEAEAASIGRYLRRHPADHGELVAALDRSPAFHFPYQRMNSGLERGLVVAYAFPPYADTSGIVMAKRIRTLGRPVDVVYNAMDRRRRTDHTTRRIAGPYTCEEAAVATPTHFSYWPSMAKFITAGMAQIQEWTEARGPYGWLYSRAHFAASHLLAATYKLAEPGVSWTAEFSDPLSRGRLDEEQGTAVEEGPVIATLRAGLAERGLPVPASDNCFGWCEEVAYALADELIFTNENQLEYMLGYCSDPELAAMARKKAVVSPHPTLSGEFYSMVEADYPLEQDLVHLAYFGVFYATRGLDDVLGALAGIDPSTRSRIRIHVFTTDQRPLRQRAAELGVEDSVRVGPYAGYLEFLNLTTRFDCLIVNDAATREYHARNPYLPSKWSDYRGSGTPVWGLVEEGSPLSRQPLQYASPVGDVDAAREVLSRMVSRRLAAQPSATAG